MNNKIFIASAMLLIGTAACKDGSEASGEYVVATERFSTRASATIAGDSNNRSNAFRRQTTATEAFSPAERVGTRVRGDFDGDGKQEYATVVKVKKGEGNPVENGSPDGYEVQFSTPGIKPYPAGCCEIRLVQEGDLNKDGADELSLFQSPENGCVCSMASYSFKKGSATLVVPVFLIPTGCDLVTDEALQQRVVAMQDGIYFYKTDMNDEQMPLVKTKVKLK